MLWMAKCTQASFCTQLSLTLYFLLFLCYGFLQLSICIFREEPKLFFCCFFFLYVLCCMLNIFFHERAILQMRNKISKFMTIERCCSSSKLFLNKNSSSFSFWFSTSYYKVELDRDWLVMGFESKGILFMKLFRN